MSDDGMQFSPTASVKASVQLNKMKEANLKYKSLLKLAKERIQAQEEELESLRGAFVHHIAITPQPNSITYKQREISLFEKEISLFDPPLTFFALLILIFLLLYSEHKSNGRTNENGATRSDDQHCNGG